MWTKSSEVLAVFLTVTSIACSSSAVPVLNDSDQSLVKSGRTAVSSSDNAATAEVTASSSTVIHNGIGCASPEVLVNGSPSPDILETVNGGSSSSAAGSGIGNIQEIQFVGAPIAAASASSPSAASLPGAEKRRICKIKCLNGVWVGPLCVMEPECPPVSSLDVNLVISSDGNKVHDETRFSCIDGYRLKGSGEAICTSSGSWSHPVPECEVSQCPEIHSGDPNLVILSQNRSYTATASFSCPAGFELQGAGYVTCNSSGSWSHQIPYCEVTTCQPLIAPANGHLLHSGHFKAGDYVEFSCDPGFEMLGSSLSLCLENGSWSQSAPQCKRVCEFPGEPVNGYIQPTKFHYDIGDGISVMCKQNYQPIGPAFIYCTSQGTWSSPLSSCQEQTSRPNLEDNYFTN